MPEYQRVAGAAEVPPGTCKTVHAGEKSLALCNVDGSFHALTNVCPHRGGPLGEGALDGGQVICPWHGWVFDVATGKMASNPDGPAATTYPVKVEGDDVLVEC